MATVKAGDASETSTFLTSLAIPNHNEWFLKTFGPTEGPRLEAKYVELQPEATSWLQKRGEAAAKNADTTVDVSVYQKPEDSPVPIVQATLRAMVQPVPIYSVSMTDGKDSKSPFFLGRFVYVDGAFRSLEWEVLQALSTAPPARIRVGGNVQHAKILRSIAPVYPALARENRIQGTVRLHVILATDGTVKEMNVVSGDPALQMSALDAVRQWQYRPTLLNGTPVEVNTTIDVIFSLR
jgi:TonB family protein